MYHLGISNPVVFDMFQSNFPINYSYICKIPPLFSRNIRSSYVFQLLKLFLWN